MDNPGSEETKPLRQVLNTNLSNDLYTEHVNALQEQICVTTNDTIWARSASGPPAPLQPGNCLTLS